MEQRMDKVGDKMGSVGCWKSQRENPWKRPDLGLEIPNQRVVQPHPFSGQTPTRVGPLIGQMEEGPRLAIGDPEKL